MQMKDVEANRVNFVGIDGARSIDLLDHWVFLKQCLAPEKEGSVFLTEKSREGDWCQVCAIGPDVGKRAHRAKTNVRGQPMDRHTNLPLHVGDFVLIPENSQYGHFERLPVMRCVGDILLGVDWEFIAHESEIMAIMELDDYGKASGLNPVGRRVLVKMDKDQTYQKGVHTPVDATDYSSTGVVARLGTGCKLYEKNGTAREYEFPVKVADRVFITYNAGIQVTIGDDSYRLISSRDILATLNGNGKS